MSADDPVVVLAITFEGTRYFVKVEGRPTARGLATLRKHLKLVEATVEADYREGDA